MDPASRAAPVVPLRNGRRRALPIARAVEARRRLTVSGGRGQSAAGTGRAWINGHEVGGPEPRYRHLMRSYD